MKLGRPLTLGAVLALGLAMPALAAGPGTPAIDGRHLDLSWMLPFVGILLSTALRRTRWGRVLNAVRENEKTAQAHAVPTTAVKLTAFCYAGFLAGLAGGVYVLVLRGARAGSFQP